MNDRVADLIVRLKSGGSTQDRLDAIEMLQELSRDRAAVEPGAHHYKLDMLVSKILETHDRAGVAAVVSPILRELDRAIQVVKDYDELLKKEQPAQPPAATLIEQLSNARLAWQRDCRCSCSGCAAFDLKLRNALTKPDDFATWRDRTAAEVANELPAGETSTAKWKPPERLVHPCIGQNCVLCQSESQPAETSEPLCLHGRPYSRGCTDCGRTRAPLSEPDAR